MIPIVNASDVAALCKLDPVLARIRAQCGNPPSWSREPGFRSLVRIILEQQVSLESARAHFQRLEESLPRLAPGEILKLSDDELRHCQVSRQKAAYLRELSSAIESGALDLAQLDALSDGEVRARLTTIKGIGAWTSDIYLMFCLHRRDVFPVGDVAVRNAVTELYGIDDREQMLRFSERWKPLRSLASYFFWHHYLNQRGRSTGQAVQNHGRTVSSRT